MSTTTFAEFSPSPQDVPAIIEALADPARSFFEVARRYQTTPDALALWLSTPAVAARVEAFETALAVRARLMVAARLPQVADALCGALAALSAEEKATPRPAAATEMDPKARAAEFAVAHRRREAIRRLGELLIRLSTHRQAPAAGRGTTGRAPKGPTSAEAAAAATRAA
jgi:hypothetical protein